MSKKEGTTALYGKCVCGARMVGRQYQSQYNGEWSYLKRCWSCRMCGACAYAYSAEDARAEIRYERSLAV
jgi:hypothetical protein